MGVSVRYLQKDSKTGRLSYRRAFPAHLRPYILNSPRELIKALGANSLDDGDAAKRFAAARDEYATIVANATKAAKGDYDALDASKIADLSEAYVREALEQDDARRWDTEERELVKSVGGQHIDTNKRFIERRRETLEAMLALYRNLQATGDMEGILKLWADEVEDLGVASGLRLDTQSKDFAQLCIAINRAAINAGTLALKRLDGEVIETPPEPERPSSPAKASTPTSKLSMGEIVRELASSAANPVSRSTQDARNTAVRYWEEAFAGVDYSSITRLQVTEWLELLAKLPANPSRKDRKLPIRDLVEKYQHSDTGRLSGKTVHVHLTNLATVWASAQRRGLIDSEKANPFSRHAVRVQRSRKATGLSVVELNAVFSLPVFTAGERPLGGRGEAAYWLPLILLFTGARPNEAAQLLVSDFEERKDGWYMSYTGEGDHPTIGARRLKTSEKGTGDRCFPVPQALIDLGLLDYIGWLQDKGELALFPQLPAWRKGLAEAWSRWWGTYARKAGAIPKDKRQAREFRHSFPTAARASGISAEALEYLQGHSAKGTNAAYGTREPLGLEIRKLRFEGLELSKVKRWEIPA